MMNSLNVIVLISGGKDSMFNMMQTVALGHTVLALANLHPPLPGHELDSWMYQTVGSEMISALAECLGVPLFQREIHGQPLVSRNDYTPQPQDEVEDLFALLSEIKAKIPQVQAVASGAILSNYQRLRVENVCQRLGLQSLSFLWQMNQESLLSCMIQNELKAIVIKVASIGLNESHLGKDIKELHPHLIRMNEKYGVHICGEGGEYESLTLDCPLFLKRIELDTTFVTCHSNDAFAPVSFLVIEKFRLIDKPGVSKDMSLRLSKDQKEELISFGTTQLQSFPPFMDLVDSLKVLRREPIPNTVEPHWMTPQTEISGSNTDDFTFISYSSLDSCSMEIEKQMESMMRSIQKELESVQLSWDHVVLVHLYLHDMSLFPRMNACYSKYFNVNPPPRVTVTTLNKKLAMDCIATATPKETLHVQGRSYWAAANIGPYAQAASVHGMTFLAGVIGLIPHTMHLASHFTDQLKYSLLNLNAILQMTQSHVLGTVCYLTSPEDMPMARCQTQNMKSLMVVVPELPRNALIEWQALGVSMSHDPILSCFSNKSRDCSWTLDRITSGNVTVLLGTCHASREESDQAFLEFKKGVLAVVDESTWMSVVLFYNPLHLSMDMNLTFWTCIPVSFIEKDASFGICVYAYQKDLKKKMDY